MKAVAVGIGLCALMLGAMAQTASADTEYEWASKVVAYNGGSGVVDARKVLDNVLGDPTKAPVVTGSGINFVSLGVGGSIVLGFDRPFGNNMAVVFETTNTSDWPVEKAMLYVGTDKENFVPVTMITSKNVKGNLTPKTEILLSNHGVGAGPWQYVKLVDHSSANTQDGFDLNAVGVVAVPTPDAAYAGMGLLGLLGGARLLKSRRNA